MKKKKTLLFASLVLSSAAIAATLQTSTAPIIWRDPGAIETLDLFWGSGSESRQPQSPFTFIEEKLSGTTAKVVVSDARGVVWDVKLASEEAHPEVAASRLLWAMGYPTQEMYFLHEGRIEGAKGLERAKEFIKSDGAFIAARFRKRDPNIVKGEGWAFASNPFVGTKESSGLIILMALINNWDTADTKNQEILNVKTPDGTTEQWFVAQDVGASFGRFKGPQGTPIKWNLAEYQKDPLVAGVEGDTLVLDYQAFGTPPTRVPLDHARWFAGLIGRLNEDQVRAAFRAGGATPQEAEGFTHKLMAKVAELRTAVGTTVQQ